MNERIKKDAEAFISRIEKKEMILDQIHILSPVSEDNEFLRVLDIYPMTLVFPYIPKNIKKMRISSAMKRLVEKTGMIFLYEETVYFLDPAIFRSFWDLFGFSKEAIIGFADMDGIGTDLANQSGWRNLYFAQLFKNAENPVAYATVEQCGKYNIIHALHRSTLDLGVKAWDIADALEKEGAVTTKWEFTTRKVEIHVSMPLEISGWRQALVIRDSEIGAESLTFYAAWKKGDDDLLYMDLFRCRHRSKTNMEQILGDIHGLLKKSSTMPMPPIRLEDVAGKMKKTLGKKLFQKFTFYMSQISPIEDDILTRAAKFAGKIKLDDDQVCYRLALGELVSKEDKTC